MDYGFVCVFVCSCVGVRVFVFLRVREFVGLFAFNFKCVCLLVWGVVGCVFACLRVCVLVYLRVRGFVVCRFVGCCGC